LTTFSFNTCRGEGLGDQKCVASNRRGDKDAHFDVASPEHSALIFLLGESVSCSPETRDSGEDTLEVTQRFADP